MLFGVNCFKLKNGAGNRTLVKMFFDIFYKSVFAMLVVDNFLNNSILIV